MRVPVPVAIAVSLATCLPAGCGSTTATSPTATSGSPDAYLEAVQAALQPPGRLAALVSTGVRERTFTTDGRELNAIVEDARVRLAAVRALRLGAPELRRQRAAFTRGYRAVLVRMEAVTGAILSGDRGRVVRASRPFFASIRELSSTVASSS